MAKDEDNPYEGIFDDIPIRKGFEYQHFAVLEFRYHQYCLMPTNFMTYLQRAKCLETMQDVINGAKDRNSKKLTGLDSEWSKHKTINQYNFEKLKANWDKYLRKKYVACKREAERLGIVFIDKEHRDIIDDEKLYKDENKK